jgi:cytochrome b subunit of formate dehydrogenase
MFKRILTFVGLLTFITVLTVLWTRDPGSILLKVAPWAFIGAVVVGISAGFAGARKKRFILFGELEKQPVRHTVGSILEHWGTAVGIFILVVSGFQIRLHGGFSSMSSHFLGLFLTLLFGTYFITDFFISKKYEALLPDAKDIFDGTIKKYLLKIEHKETGKYQSSQKSAFLVFIILGGQIALSGAVKLLLFYIRVPPTIVETATLIHDVSAFLFVLMLIVHVFLVLAMREHRPLLGSWLTGRHPGKHVSRPVQLLSIPVVDASEKIPQTVNDNRINIILPAKKITPPVSDPVPAEMEQAGLPDAESNEMVLQTDADDIADIIESADICEQPVVDDWSFGQIEKASIPFNEIDETIPDFGSEKPVELDWPIEQESNTR